MLSASLDTLLKLSKTIYPQKLFANNCATLYLVKSDLVIVFYTTSVHWTSHFLKGTRNTRSCLTGHPVAKAKGLLEISNTNSITDFGLD